MEIAIRKIGARGIQRYGLDDHFARPRLDCLPIHQIVFGDESCLRFSSQQRKYTLRSQ